MIKAIVYTSNSGSTQKYANMLSEELAIPVYTYEEAKNIFTKEDEIIYMGWVFCGRIAKYCRALDHFNIKAVCAVGINKTKSIAVSRIKCKNLIENECFYLRGAYNKENQKGFIKLVMKFAAVIVKIDVKSNSQSTLSDLENLDMLYNGRNYINKDELEDVIKWAKNKELCEK